MVRDEQYEFLEYEDKAIIAQTNRELHYNVYSYYRYYCVY